MHVDVSVVRAYDAYIYSHVAAERKNVLGRVLQRNRTNRVREREREKEDIDISIYLSSW